MDVLIGNNPHRDPLKLDGAISLQVYTFEDGSTLSISHGAAGLSSLLQEHNKATASKKGINVFVN